MGTGRALRGDTVLSRAKGSGARTWIAASRSCALRAVFLSVSRALCSLRPRPVKSDKESTVAMAGTPETKRKLWGNSAR